MYCFRNIWVFWGSQSGQNNSKITIHTTLGHFNSIYTSQNIALNTFSGSTILWRHSGKYESLNVLLWWYTGLLSDSEGLKIAQNDHICHFWVHHEHFYFTKDILNTFSCSTNLWRLLGEYEPLNVLLS